MPRKVYEGTEIRGWTSEGMWEAWCSYNGEIISRRGSSRAVAEQQVVQAIQYRNRPAPRPMCMASRRVDLALSA